MDTDSDDELRSRLRAGDPATRVLPATAAQVAQRVEDTMKQAPSPTPRSRWAVWIAAAAAVLVVGGLGFVWASRSVFGDGSPVAGSQDSVTTLTVPEAGDAKCMVVNVDVLRAQQFAFAGTVTKVADGQATLKVSHWYRGADTDVVVVKAPDADLQSLLGAVDFVVGKDYLVSGSDSKVTLCGFTAVQSAELTDLYDEAYGG